MKINNITKYIYKYNNLFLSPIAFIRFKMSDSDTYISKQGVKYYSLHNINNCLCFFNTALHMLKTSKTLTKLLQNENIYNIAMNNFHILFAPLCYYINNDNKYIIEKAIEETSKYIVYNGYVVDWLLNNYYFPIIYHLVNNNDNIMMNIWHEMSMEKHMLKNIDEDNIVFIDEQIHKELTDIIRQYRSSFPSILKKYNDDNLNYDCVIMEIYPYNNNQNGHVAAVIDGEVILDRSKCCSFNKYINEEIIDFYKIRFDYIKPKFKQYIKFEPLEMNLYSYSYTNKQHMLTGGGNNKHNIKYLNKKFNSTSYIPLIIMILMFIVFVIIIVIYIIINTNKKNKNNYQYK